MRRIGESSKLHSINLPSTGGRIADTRPEAERPRDPDRGRYHARYYASNPRPRPEFRGFNAETTASALFLAMLGAITGDQRFAVGAEHGMSFIEREVLPRQLWFDFETFLSCARKDYSIFDSQYPQNNLAEIQALTAMLPSLI